MMMRSMQEEEEEAILEFGHYSSYFVQSPSSVSHANSITYQSDLNNLCRTHNNHSNDYPPTKPLLHNQDAPVVAGTTTSFANLSRCSSSRASTTSFLHDDKMTMTVLPLSDNHHHPNNVTLNKSACKNNNNNNNISILVPAAAASALKKLGKVVDNNGDDDDEEDNEGHCWQYFSFSTYPSSSVWIALQLLWRFLLSVLVALLVFYLVTKPSPPHLSLKVTGVNQFELPEGLDLTGVATNFLSCNISMGLIIDNKSKVFGLHVLSPVVDIYFGLVPLVLSQGSELYVKSREWREMEVYAGTKKKAMYGAGTNMKDMLNSGRGLPLLITLRFSSYVRVVPNLIQSDFHHHAHCLLLLQNLYDKKHHSQLYNTTCVVTS